MTTLGGCLGHVQGSRVIAAVEYGPRHSGRGVDHLSGGVSTLDSPQKVRRMACEMPFSARGGCSVCLRDNLGVEETGGRSDKERALVVRHGRRHAVQQCTVCRDAARRIAARREIHE
ncbi:hypothetical protein [Streptomyces sp. A5-4]|uniref:hypothetical protein n=1 Tax=Streptomyces sp. A5-4 TaxID=3384771 RepID=UPI003DA95491